MKFYPLVDCPSSEDLKGLGLNWSDVANITSPNGNFHWKNPFRIGIKGIVAVPTDQKRPPRQGEWYLSGAVVEAYQASKDLSQSFRIARLVIESKIVHTIVKR